MDVPALFEALHRHMIIPVVLVFVLMAVSAYLPRRKPEMERNARIPLDDDR